MKNCDIVNDLLPLYVDDLLSDESVQFVKEHLSICKTCSDHYEDMKSNLNVVIDPENDIIEPQKVFDQYMRREKHMVVSLTLFAVSIGLFWADWFIMQYAWENFYDGINRIAEFALIPMLALACLFGMISVSRIIKKNKQTKNRSWFKTGVLITALAAILIVHIIPLVELGKTGYDIIALTNVESTESENGEFFLVLPNLVYEGKTMKVKCDEETYASVVVDKNVLYDVSYRIKLFSKTEGVLESIDLDHYIDNNRYLESEPPEAST